ncbi:flavodoxin, partial [Sutterella sp.]|uniref:flavodoxin n=1 Tax=Sutterella sp. TaxID=1981025 RepID=UPI0026DFB48D
LTGCDVFLLEPAEPYPSEYQETVNRAVPERESDARPALKRLPDLSGYDTVVIGHPIWGGKMPMMFYTLLEDKGVQAALKGKTILHWATNGGSGLGDSQREITRLLPESRILPGLDLYGWGGLRSPGSIRPWLEQNGIAVRGS